MEPQKNDLLNKANNYSSDFKNSLIPSDKTLSKMSQNIGEKVGQVASKISSSTSGYAKASQSYVKENPFRSIAYAATAGILTGSLLTMLSRRRK